VAASRYEKPKWYKTGTSACLMAQLKKGFDGKDSDWYDFHSVAKGDIAPIPI
jgi:hypothetical protein